MVPFAELVTRFADLLAEDPTFNREKFNRTCGYDWTVK